MLLPDFLKYVYLLAALSLVVFILIGLIINKGEERVRELKTVGLYLLNAPLVLQGVWIVILMVRIGIGVWFDLYPIITEGITQVNTSLPKVTIVAMLLLSINVFLLHKSLRSDNRPAAAGWQLLSFIISCFLLTNLAFNYFHVERIGANNTPFIDYTTNSIFLFLSIPAIVLLIVLMAKPDTQKHALLRYCSIMVMWCLGLLLLPVLFALIFLVFKYSFGWLYKAEWLQVIMKWAIPLTLALLVALLNGYTFMKAVRTKALAIILPAAIFCLLPLGFCFYYLLTLSSHSIFDAVISFIINLFSLLLFAIIQAFVKDGLSKQPQSIIP